MENPDYFALFAQYEAETDPQIRANLITQIYQFNEILIPAEIELFGYMQDDYVENNPGYINTEYNSYVGVYIDDDGNYSGVYP